MSKCNINIQTLKEQVKIIDLANRLNIKINKNLAQCINPSHSDKHPSMRFNDNTNRFHCFSCGIGGDVIDLYSMHQSVTMGQAMRALATIYAPHLINNTSNLAISIPIKHAAPKISYPTKTKTIKSFSHIYEEFKQCCGKLDKASINYLTGPGRWLEKKTIEHFKIFNIKDRSQYNTIIYRLKNKYGNEDVKDSGIKTLYTFVGNKIPAVIVPFYENGHIEYLWTRRIDGKNKRIKVLNLRGRPVPIFNLEIFNSIQHGDKLNICEGVFDAMMATQEGENAIAVLGVGNCLSASLEQAKHFNVHICFDNDEAGTKASKKIQQYFQQQYNKLVEIKQFPSGVNDVTEYYNYLNNKNITSNTT